MMSSCGLSGPLRRATVTICAPEASMSVHDPARELPVPTKSGEENRVPAIVNISATAHEAVSAPPGRRPGACARRNWSVRRSCRSIQRQRSGVHGLRQIEQGAPGRDTLLLAVTDDVHYGA